MYECYAATVVGVVCAAGAIAALAVSRTMRPLPYTVVHITAVLVMIALVTVGFEKVPLAARYPQETVSRLLYIAVSWLAFVGTFAVHRVIQPDPQRPTGIGEGELE